MLCRPLLFAFWAYGTGYLFPIVGEDVDVDLVKGEVVVKIQKGHYEYNGFGTTVYQQQDS